jgi:hypothetical protein
MINITLKRAMAAAILAGVSFGANATEKNLGNIATNIPTAFNGSVLTPGAFNDVFSFTLPSAGPGIGGSGFTVQNFPLTLPNNGGSFNTILTSVSLVSDPDGKPFDSDDKVLQTVSGTGSGPLSFSWDSSLTGPAYLTVAGIANGTSGGLYNGAISVSAIPEPEAFAMLLAGLGLMGAVVRRRGISKTS